MIMRMWHGRVPTSKAGSRYMSLHIEHFWTSYSRLPIGWGQYQRIYSGARRRWGYSFHYDDVLGESGCDKGFCGRWFRVGKILPRRRGLFTRVWTSGCTLRSCRTILECLWLCSLWINRHHRTIQLDSSRDSFWSVFVLAPLAFSILEPAFFSIFTLTRRILVNHSIIGRYWYLPYGGVCRMEKSSPMFVGRISLSAESLGKTFHHRQVWKPALRRCL